jgi:hypothetical protein
MVRLLQCSLFEACGELGATPDANFGVCPANVNTFGDLAIW